MLRLCASGPLRGLLLIGVAGIIVAATGSRGDAGGTRLRPWKIAWLRENSGLSAWASQRRQTFVLTGTKKKGPDDYPAAWSADGQYIAFSRSSSDQPGIYIVRVGHGAPRRLAETFAFAHAEVAWSPDGRKIAYSVDCEEDLSSSTCVSGPTGTTALYTIDRDGSDPRQLVALPAATTFEPQIRGLAWSPDSRRIAYVANDTFLYTIGSNGGAPRLVAAERNPDYTVGNPAWSPNGRWIAYGGHCYVALLGGDIDCSLVASSSRGAKRRVLLNSPGDTGVSPPAWTPDSRTLLYARVGRPALFRIDFATARRRRIMRVFAAGVTVARDGRSFAFIPEPFAGFTKPAVATLTGQIVARGPKIPYYDTVGSHGNVSLWIG
jgi:dipeptidyl aminopeptidase/acylaminoacyl peptidase